MPSAFVAISALEYFVMGAFAKAVATYVTYPLQIAQSKLRADKKTNTAKGIVKFIPHIRALISLL